VALAGCHVGGGGWGTFPLGCEPGGWVVEGRGGGARGGGAHGLGLESLRREEGLVACGMGAVGGTRRCGGAAAGAGSVGCRTAGGRDRACGWVPWRGPGAAR